MTDWTKHDFGPGTDVCARCKGEKSPARRGSKWCSKCDGEMRARKDVTDALDRASQGGVVRRTRIVR